MAKNADVYFLCDPWQIIEEGWNRERNLVSESVFSLANEYMGVRGFAEEGVTAESLRGSYFNGIYEETGIGNSYKGIVNKVHFMVTAVDWLYTEIRAGKEMLDMAECDIRNFRRTLDMREGTLKRSFDWHTKSGQIVHIEMIRFLGMENPCEAFQKIKCSVSNGDIKVNVIIANNFNTGHGWDKKNFWNLIKREWFENGAAVQGQTMQSGQQIFSGFTFKTSKGAKWKKQEGEKSAGFNIVLPLKDGKEAWIEKSVYNFSVKERNADTGTVWQKCRKIISDGLPAYDTALEQQRKYWDAFWKNADIRIEGDPVNQQGIRFCIFQMNQTYHGNDPSNNIGAKGLTGEVYGGHTFWDTETYCLPFYLFSNLKAAKNLLNYRYATLDAARERAKMLDCKGACYPIATLNGDEACSLWQHASLQFQPSTAVAYGIAHYCNVSGDTEFLYTHGAEMLVEISRLLESRGSWNNDGTGFGFYMVMGPDEFHMMVNHNSYTNFMAKKAFEYTEQTLKEMEEKSPAQYAALCKKINLTENERKNFTRCADKMIILYDEKTKLFEQHDGYFKLPHIEISQIPVTDFPLYNNWSYDRIYRTDMIKQPDVLMFLFLHSHEFSEEVKRKNYEFYEPHTIHESSLSPSIHSIFASELDKPEDAFRFFAFATRMDLDNYNRNSSEGLHTTSIAAAWMNIVYGFAGLRSGGETLSLAPVLPEQWTEYEFGILCRNVHIRVKISAGEAEFFAAGPFSDSIPLNVYGKHYDFTSEGLKIPLKK